MSEEEEIVECIALLSFIGHPSIEFVFWWLIISVVVVDTDLHNKSVSD